MAYEFLDSLVLTPPPAWMLAKLRGEDKPAAALEYLNADMPDQVIERPRAAAPVDATDHGAQRLLDDCAAAVRGAAEGQRNHELNRAAHTLGGLVAAGRLQRGVAEQALLAAAVSLTADDGEAATRATIKSGLDSGIAKGAIESRPMPARDKEAPDHLPGGALPPGQTPAKRAPQADKPTHSDLAREWLASHPDTAYGLGEFRRYALGIWGEVKHNAAEREIERMLDHAKERGVKQTSSVLGSVLKLSQVKALVDDDQWDADPNVLVCGNGMLHIPTMTLLDHDKNAYQTSGVAYDYDPLATAPTFEYVLKSTQPDEVADFLQEFAGYSLTIDTSHEISLWLWGPPGGGKSTVIEGIRSMLGSRCGELGLSSIERSTFGLANLPGKTLMVSTESPSMYMQATDRVNKIISGEPIMVERKYRDAYEIRPRAKVLWAMNDIPRIPDPNDGIFRRVRVIKFSALGREKDTTIKDKVLMEGAGILNWALAGLTRLRARGKFVTPPQVKAATEQFQRDNDVPATFVAECCVTGHEYAVQSAALYDEYKNWCIKNGHKAQSSTSVAGEWRRLGFDKVRGAAGVRWHGVGLKAIEDQ